MPSVNARPLRNALTQQTEARYNGHQQKRRNNGRNGLRSTELTPRSRKASTLARSASESFCGASELDFLVAVQGFTPLPESTLYWVIRMNQASDQSRLSRLFSSHSGTDVRVVLLGSLRSTVPVTRQWGMMVE